MLNAIGETSMQAAYCAATHSSVQSKEVLESRPGQEARLVKTIGPVNSVQPEPGAEEGTRNRTKLDHGNVVIETYTESGKLVKITPPGFLPFGKIA